MNWSENRIITPLLGRAVRKIHEIDFSFVLPYISSLPLAQGQSLAYLRGFVCGLCDYDWRSLALGNRWVRSGTYRAMQMIRPEATRLFWGMATVRRFMHNSKEEWQAGLFSRPVMERVTAKSTLNGCGEIIKACQSGRGVVLVSCHWDSFCMGMVLLGMNGLIVNCINTKAVFEDSRVNPRVVQFLKQKYSNMERLMGGKMEYHETNMDFFYKALDRGEVVTLMGDVPGTKSNIYIPFLNTKFRMPLGAWHMAKQTGSLLGGYICMQEGIGKYSVVCLPPREIDPTSPEKTLRPVYAFLEDWIRKYPERWVAADLLPGYH